MKPERPKLNGGGEEINADWLHNDRFNADQSAFWIHLNLNGHRIMPGEEDCVLKD